MPDLFSVLPISESALLSFSVSFKKKTKKKNAQSELGSIAEAAFVSFLMSQQYQPFTLLGETNTEPFTNNYLFLFNNIL